MRAVVFTGGVLRPGRFTQAALKSADLIIAADSGAGTALEFGVWPSVVIGDLDSLDQTSQKRLEAKGAQFIVHESTKDQTDTELAIDYAAKKGANDITVLGGIEGDRIDHILSNLFLGLNSKVPVKFANGDTLVWSNRGPENIVIDGGRGHLISLIPLTSRVSGVTTSGLRYALNHETLRMNKSRGVSNVMTRKRASVTLGRGKLLIVQNVGEG